MMKPKNKTILYLAKSEKSALLKRRAIDDYFGVAELDVLSNGKPIIKNPDGYYISVAHSGGVVGIVISDVAVGLDIQLREDRNNSRLISFFHESEREEDFYDLWVKKEAVGKLTGDGIFVQKGKRLADGYVFTDISKQLSSYADMPFSAVVATQKRVDIDVKYDETEL